MAEISAAQVHSDVLSLFDEAWPRLSTRLEGLTRDEYLWEPVPGCWTVRQTADGVLADWADPDPDPAPVTTIAWRLWHVAVDCLDSYSARVFDARGTEFVGQEFTLEVDEALTALAASGEVFRSGLVERSPESLYDLLGPAWGPYHASTFLALMLHALDEVIHHAAEIALLRDLYERAAFHRMSDARVASLLTEVGLPVEAADGVTIAGDDPIYASPFPIASSAAVALGAAAAAAALIWRDKTGEEQTVNVDTRRAGVSLLSFVFQQLLDGTTPQRVADNPLIALYECRDERWVHLHGAFPRLADPTRRVLGIGEGADAGAIRAAVAKWEAQALEDALADARMCGAMVRTSDEWAAHPQGQALGALARVEIEKIGDSPPEPAGGMARPLDGVRVLDLTRILAGPTNGRTLAEHGADVLLVNSPKLDNVPPFVMDTSHGKRSTFLDLDDPDDGARLLDIAASADVFAQGYRGGAMDRRGLGPEELAARRPGLVYVTMNCYGDAGPWRQRPGWEQLAQTVSGIADVQGAIGPPVLIPAAACDYTTGYLAALGTMAALWRRSREGGSYHVRASLCQTAMWFAREPRVDRDKATGFGEVADFLVTTDTPFGRLRHLGPVAQMSATPAHWASPTTPLGSHAPEWSSANSTPPAGK